MKKSKIMRSLLTFGFLFVTLLGVSCKHDKGGNKKPNPKPDPKPPITQKFKVSFRSNPKGMATIKASAEGIESVSTNDLGSIEVEAGKTVTFVASNINEEKLVDEWVNVTKVSEDKMTATLEVTKNVVVILKLQDRPVPMVKVTYSIVNEFDKDGIHQGMLGVIDKTAGDKTVNSGDSVPLRHIIHITANPNNYNGKHRIKEWVFKSPEMTVENTEEEVLIDVMEQYVDGGIDFTVEFEKGEPPEPPLPDGKVRVKAGVFLWDDLEEVNFIEGGLLYYTLNDETEEQGGTNMALPQGTTVAYRLEPKPGKALYKWDGEGVEGMEIDSSDNKKVKLVANKDMYLKAIMKNEGMSIFSVFIKDENDQFVNEDVARVIAKTKNEHDELIDCKVSKKYVEGPTGKDVILQLMPQDPSYQIDVITQTPPETQVVKDANNPNKFEVKNVKDDIVITIKMKKVETVNITIDGDANVKAENKKTFKVHKSTSWKVLKEMSEIKNVEFSEGYELDKWKQDSASGTELSDDYKFESNKTIFVSSKIQMRVLTYSVKDKQEKDVDSANVSLAATKEGGGSIQSGDSVPYGTKINFVATITNKNYQIKHWSWNVQEDPSTQTTDRTKASMTMRGGNEEVILTVAEAVKITIKGDDNVKDESKVSFFVDKGSKWREVSWNKEIREVKFKDGYKLDKWLKGEDASSPELKDDDVFESATTIFATSKDVNLMKFSYKVKDKDWKDMKDTDYTIVVKNVETGEAVANGADVLKGTKISIEISFTNTKLKVRYWTPDSAKDPNNPNKGLVTIGDGNMEVIMAVDEAIRVTIDGDEHLKSESKKSFDAWKGVDWWLIRDGQGDYAFFKDLIKFDDGWEADKYLKDNAQGAELEWNTKLNEDTKVYITSKQKES